LKECFISILQVNMYIQYIEIIDFGTLIDDNEFIDFPEGKQFRNQPNL